jgi:very-short-patch-repair endonuclease
MIANNHLNGQGCPDCGGTKKLTKEQFIEKANKIHGNKYDYSKVEYINNKTRVCIICPKHGEFLMRPNDHLSGHGCPDCGGTKKDSTESIINKFKKIHGDKYDYSKVNYFNAHTNVLIVCPIHGEFPQSPHDHLKGCGCPKCNQSKLEKEIEQLLIENKIEYLSQKHYEWLKRQTLDFYLPQYNIAIECQGRQHFTDNNFFELFEVIKERDERKRKLCEEHGIKLLYYSNLGIDYPYEVFEDKEELLEEILTKNCEESYEN